MKPTLDLESIKDRPLEERHAMLLSWNGALNDSYERIAAERDRLTKRNATLEKALTFATKYVMKAVADGLMEDCAVPASVALVRLRAVLEERS